jgi:hypothetical protein
MLHLVQCYTLTFLQCGVELVNEVYSSVPWQASALIILFCRNVEIFKKTKIFKQNIFVTENIESFQNFEILNYYIFDVESSIVY